MDDLDGVSQDQISVNTSMIVDGLTKDKSKSMNAHSQQVFTNTPGFTGRNNQQILKGNVKDSRNCVHGNLMMPPSKSDDQNSNEMMGMTRDHSNSYCQLCYLE